MILEHFFIAGKVVSEKKKGVESKPPLHGDLPYMFLPLAKLYGSGCGAVPSLRTVEIRRWKKVTALCSVTGEIIQFFVLVVVVWLEMWKEKAKPRK
jgi:hypothetical protein